MRDDYIRDEDDDEDMLLFNPLWKIMPSLAFVDGKGPVILTCVEHTGGTTKMYIHPCRWKHNLPSKHSDQVCQTVMEPRLIRPTRSSAYSTSYQMFQQCGTFNGIDTCSATMHGRFDLPPSLLLQESESRSIYNRSDINAHLSSLVSQGVISDVVAQSKVEAAQSFSQSVDYEKYYAGATYVSLENSMVMQSEMSNRRVHGILERDDSPDVPIMFNKYWSSKFF